MNDQEYAATIHRLSPSQRRVFDVILERGPLTDDETHEAIGRGGAADLTRPRRNELRKLGLVRPAGKRGGRQLWAATPASEVEAVAEAARQAGPRVRPVTDRDLDTRVGTFLELLADPEVQEAVKDPAGSATKRQRQRVRGARARAERERRRELNEALEAKHPAVEAIEVRNAVKDGAAKLSDLLEMTAKEWDRRALLGQEAVAVGEFERILRAVEELEEQAEAAYDLAARTAGLPGRAPARRDYDFEYDDGEIEEVEDRELGNGHGDLGELIVRLGGNTRLALPPASGT